MALPWNVQGLESRSIPAAALESNIIPLISLILERVVQQSANWASQQCSMSPCLGSFYAASSPQISIEQYLGRIFHFSGVSPNCLILAMIYIEKLMARDRSMCLTTLNVHRIVATAVMTAAKFLEDVTCPNRSWAKIAGLPLEEMNTLELDFLFLLDFSLHVSAEAFAQYYHTVLKAYTCVAVQQQALEEHRIQQQEELARRQLIETMYATRWVANEYGVDLSLSRRAPAQTSRVTYQPQHVQYFPSTPCAGPTSVICCTAYSAAPEQDFFRVSCC